MLHSDLATVFFILVPQRLLQGINVVFSVSEVLVPDPFNEVTLVALLILGENQRILHLISGVLLLKGFEAFLELLVRLDREELYEDSFERLLLKEVSCLTRINVLVSLDKAILEIVEHLHLIHIDLLVHLAL